MFVCFYFLLITRPTITEANAAHLFSPGGATVAQHDAPISDLAPAFLCEKKKSLRRREKVGMARDGYLRIISHTSPGSGDITVLGLIHVDASPITPPNGNHINHIDSWPPGPRSAGVMYTKVGGKGYPIIPS